MVFSFQATYENGVLRPSLPLSLPDRTRVEVTVKAADEPLVEAEEDEEEEVRPEPAHLTVDEFRRIVDQHALQANRSLPVDFDRHDIYADHD
jgi:predicted DNA-binding antitoxin AbrB/MazE fold protein